MQVSHASDHITHAVIGGKKNIDFTISDSAEFFQILSSALYKDPTLAMIRETICNAWDAHIDSGRIDRPISITVSDDKLVIKDYGRGIPDSLIGPIYGTYGASTKKNDGRQTGGFGLGCKSPFAYTDHFEVISSHAGKRTIYNMLKSSGEAMGKPSITPIATFDTDETGITVSIPLKGDYTDQKIPHLIKQVIFNGDIKAMFNGELLPTIELNQAENGFLLINDNANDGTRNVNHLCVHRIYVRYGNVIYPIETHTQYESLFSKVNGLLEKHYSCRLVLQADPDSISITPSREALTMSDITVETVTGLLQKFLAMFFRNQKVMSLHKEMIYDYVEEAATNTSISLTGKLPYREWVIPGVPNTTGNKFLRSSEDFALMEVLLRYSGRTRQKIKTKTWLQYIIQYFIGMVSIGQLQRGITQSWIRHALKHKKQLQAPGYNRDWGNDESDIATKWWQKRIMVPLVQSALKLVPGFSVKNLHYYSPVSNSHGGSGSYYHSKPKKEVMTVSNIRIDTHTGNIIHLFPTTVVLCHNADQVVKRVDTVLKSSITAPCSFHMGAYFVYVVSRKKGEDEAVLNAFQKVKGLHVMNLMGRLPIEQEIYEERLAKIQQARIDAAAGKTPSIRPPKKVRPGLVRLDELLEDNNKRINTKILADKLDPVRIVQPEFIELVSTGEDKHHKTENFQGKALYAIVKLYGHLGAITNNSGTYQKYVKDKKVLKLPDYLIEKVIPLIKDSPTLVAHRGMALSKMEDYIEDNIGDYHYRTQVKSILKLLVNDDDLVNNITGYIRPSVTDDLLLTVWDDIKHNFQYRNVKEITDLTTEIDATPLNPTIKAYLDVLIANKLLAMIDVDTTVNLMRDYRNKPVELAKIRSTIQALLN